MNTSPRSSRQRKVPFLATARALVETMTPAGTLLPRGDPDKILAEIASYCSALWIRIALRIGLGWFAFRALLATGRRFHRLSMERRDQLLRVWEARRLDGYMVKLVTAPFKVAYVFDADNRSKLGFPKVVPAVAENPRWLQQVQPAASLQSSESLEADVVVIGTGAGGAAAAYELASRGLAVVILEEGHYYRRHDFNGDLVEMMQKLYRHWGTTGSVGNAVIGIPIGRGVGGTTTINSGSCLRTPDWVLEEWRQEGLVDFTPENLEPYFSLVEEVLEVQPGEAKCVGAIGQVMDKGARAMGFTDTHAITRNAAGCDGQALCQFGCPTDAKKSTNVSFIPRALQSGAFLYTDVRAHTLIRENDQVRGVVATGNGASGQPVQLTVKARAVVVAMGTLSTPIFLAQNGIRNPWVGRNLSIHPACGATCLFPELDFRNRATIPQGFAVSDLRREGLMFEGATVPPIAHCLLGPSHGGSDGFVRNFENYDHTGYFGFMVKDTSRGRVYRHSFKGRPIVSYWLNHYDFMLFRKGMDLQIRMYLRAGATAVFPLGRPGLPVIHNEAELDRFMASRLHPLDFAITAYHPLGTARVAGTMRAGVCAPDHSVWGAPGLYVMDGSSVPSSLGVNPQVTIMTMATRAARILAEKLA